MPDLKSLENVYLVLMFIVPGLVAMFCRAQFLTGRVPPQAEAILPSLALSFIYYALVFPIIDLVPVPKGKSVFGVMAWIGLLFIGPAAFGAVLGIGTQKGWGRNLLRWLLRWPGVNTVHQMPTAWDWKFNQMRPEWVLVTLKDGTKFGGWFGKGSFAASDGKDHDLYVQQVFDLDDDSCWSDRGSSVLIAAGEIRTVEFFPASQAGDQQ